MKKLKFPFYLSLLMTIILISGTSNNNVVSNKISDSQPIVAGDTIILPLLPSPGLTLCSFDGVHTGHFYSFWNANKQSNKYFVATSVQSSPKLSQVKPDHKEVGEFSWSHVLFLLFCGFAVALVAALNEF